MIPRFDPSQDMEGVASHVPHMDHFYDNSLQTGLMRDLAIDLEVLGEHVVLLGNQVCDSYNFQNPTLFSFEWMVGGWEE